MGKTKGPYNPEYPVGTKVRIVDKDRLERFSREWKYHNPLEPSQIQFGGIEAEVSSVGFYHGGDELYQLEDVPRVWHEQCLEPVSDI